MIINNQYFISDIYLPEAQPSVGSPSGVVNKLNVIIDEREKEFLIKSFGYDMYYEFLQQIDINEPTLIKSGADAKWNYLMNGHNYVNTDGKNRIWNGLRYKSDPINGDYDRSLLAYYVYYWYENRNDLLKGNITTGRGRGKNMVEAPNSEGASYAWRKMVELTQGSKKAPIFYETKHGVGVDYYANQNNRDVSLYGFINEMNTLDETNYPDFIPGYWEEGVNSLGI